MNWKKIATGTIAYLIVITIYAAFFAYPVKPAEMGYGEYKEVENKVYSTFPYVVYRIYIRESITPAILMIATVRTPFVPDSTYSKVLRSLEGIIENKTKEEYNADIDLVLVGTKKANIGNHIAVMYEYDVHLRYLNPYESWIRPDTVKLYFGAFFCNERYESIIVAYVEPPVFKGDFQKVMEGIKC